MRLPKRCGFAHIFDYIIQYYHWKRKGCGYKSSLLVGRFSELTLDLFASLYYTLMVMIKRTFWRAEDGYT